MRTALKLPLAVFLVSAGVTACRDASANPSAEQAELKRDLELAASPTINLAGPKVDPALLTLEGQPRSTPQNATTVRRGAGNRAVRSQAPTVRAEPVSDVAAVDEAEVVETMAEAAAPEAGEPVAVAPRPTEVVPVGGSGDYGSAGNGGIFGGSGGGVVIRGGGVDGDNCELHRRGGRRGGTPVYGIQRSGAHTSGPTIVQGRFPIGTSGLPGGVAQGRRSGASSIPRTSGMQTVSRPGGMGRRGR